MVFRPAFTIFWRTLEVIWMKMELQTGQFLAKRAIRNLNLQTQICWFSCQGKYSLFCNLIVKNSHNKIVSILPDPRWHTNVPTVRRWWSPCSCWWWEAWWPWAPDLSLSSSRCACSCRPSCEWSRPVVPVAGQWRSCCPRRPSRLTETLIKQIAGKTK